jgi:hypothetical protein
MLKAAGSYLTGAEDKLRIAAPPPPGWRNVVAWNCAEDPAAAILPRSPGTNPCA